jgi:hypothetical protein
MIVFMYHSSATACMLTFFVIIFMIIFGVFLRAITRIEKNRHDAV